MAKITNLKRTVTSAATVIAGDSTDVASLTDVNDFMSDVGDWFRSEASQNTLDWIYSDKRQEALFTLDGPTQQVLAERAATHTVTRTLPVHTMSMSTSAPSPSSSSNDRRLNQSPLPGNCQVTSIPSRSTSNVISSPAPSSPLPSPSPAPSQVRRKPVGGHPAKQSDPQQAEPNSRDVPSDLAVATSVPEPASSPKVQVPRLDVPEEPTHKSPRKRLSWFRFSKSTSSLIVRSPMMDDPQSRTSRWRKAKLPRKLKIVLVGDGASGKTCLLM